jgi:hypothetical protein
VLFIPWPDFVKLALFNICSSPINNWVGRWRREENPIWVEAKGVPYVRCVSTSLNYEEALTYHRSDGIAKAKCVDSQLLHDRKRAEPRSWPKMVLETWPRD